MAWQYFNDTGIVGGTSNMADQTFYIDSYKGSDVTGLGSNALPFQSIQKALDEATEGTLHDAGADLILAGYFEEGDFSGRSAVSVISEGNVIIDGSQNLHFQFSLPYSTYRNISFNYNRFNTRARRKYGRLTIQNFSGQVIFGDYGHISSVHSTVLSKVYSTTFINCTRINRGTQYFGVANGACYITDVKDCVIKDCPTVYITNQSSGPRLTFFHNNTVINSFINSDIVQNNISTQSCYYDSNSSIRIDALQLTAGVFDHCHLEGDSVNKIYIGNNAYTNSDLATAANVAFNANGRLSTDATEFNAITPSDYTYPNTAVNATAGYLGKHIGAFGIAEGGLNVDNSGYWSLSNITVTGTGTSSVAKLTTSGVGTLESTYGVTMSTDKDVYLGELTLPGMVNGYADGQTIDTTKSADGSSPSMNTVQIKVSTDNITYSPNWIEVPYGSIPMIDSNGVGSGSATYSTSGNQRIICKYIKYKITLRDDEVTIP